MVQTAFSTPRSGEIVQVTRIRWQRYGVAVLAVAIAQLLKLLLNPLIQVESPFLLFFAAVMVSTWYGGLGSGLLAVALATLASNYFLSPTDMHQVTSLGQNLQNLQLIIFVLETVLIAVLIAALSSARRAEARTLGARESEERFRQIAENIHEVVWVADPVVSQMLYVNPMYEEMWGRSCESLYRQPTSFLDGIHPEDRDRVTAAFEKRVRGKYDIVRDTDGCAVRVVGCTLDLTQRQQIEEERNQLLRREQEARKQAEEASRTKDEFLAIVSHELRSPLNAILGWTRLLRSRKYDAVKTAQALEVIERNARAQTQLIEDLLDVSRIIQGKIRLYVRSIRSLLDAIQNTKRE